MKARQSILKRYSEKYPVLLKEVYKHPEELHLIGNADLLEKPCIGIVGTRKYSEYGKYVTEKIISELAAYDIAVVSGLAKGIDEIAHRACLENEVPTIAVLGSGFENIYPRSNIELAREIAGKGLLISEYSDDTPPLKHHFPQRNRIISGLSLVTLVVEAPESSGALITSRFALEQNREVAVIPGDIDRENSKGILKLLQTGGAYPVSSGDEIIQLISKPPKLAFPQEDLLPGTPQPKTTPLQKQILTHLTPSRPVALDQILLHLKTSPPAVMAELSIMEVNGLVFTRNGKYLKKC